MQNVGSWRRSPRSSPLRAQSHDGDRIATSSPRDGGPPTACRICWGEGGEMVAPCRCRGTMKYVHTRCLTQWQVELAAARGAAGARECDVCKHGWKPAYRGLGAAAAPPPRGLAASALRAAAALAPHAWTLLSWWRIVAVAQGVLSAMEAGALGWRIGLRYSGAAAAEALRSSGSGGGGTVVHWAPFSVWAVNQVPPMHLPLTLAIYLAASSSAALQGLVTGAAGLYAGAVSGFAHGVVLTSLQTLKILGGGADVVARGARAVLRVLGALAAALLGRG